jgi:hypothetical protein
VLCSECSLIAHFKCASHAPPTCNLQAQLPISAEQAEKSNSSNMYVDPRDTRTDFQVSNFPLGPISEVPYPSHRGGLSLDILHPPQYSLVRSPTAARFLKPESESSTSSGGSTGTSSLSDDSSQHSLVRPPKASKFLSPFRPENESSTSSGGSTGTSSLWSAATGTDDSSTRYHGMQSAMFDVDTRASDSLLSTMDNVDALKTSSVVSDSRAHNHNVNRIEGRLLGRAQKKRDRDTNSCNVQ